MEIGSILKQATAVKKATGYSSAIDFLISSYDSIQSEDLGRLLDKIYTYFNKDRANLKVREFIFDLIHSKKINEYSGLLSSYYWMLNDYESYRLTINYEISRVNPSDPWRYCYDLQRFQCSLCNYYQVKGLNKEDNAIEFLYNSFSSFFYDLAGELMQYDMNFYHFASAFRYENEFAFHHPTRLIPMNSTIDGWFEENTYEKECLETLKCSMSVEEIRKLIRQKFFYDFPKQLGFNIDVLGTSLPDGKKFFLNFFSVKDLKDFFEISDKMQHWRVGIASKAAGIISEESINILKVIYKK